MKADAASFPIGVRSVACIGHRAGLDEVGHVPQLVDGKLEIAENLPDVLRQRGETDLPARRTAERSMVATGSPGPP